MANEQRRAALKAELHALNTALKEGQQKTDAASIEQQGLRLAELISLLAQIADEFDPGWLERGSSHLEELSGL